MRRNARYYLGRVVKSTNLKQADIIQAILDPAILIKDKNRYTFTDLHIIGTKDAPNGVIGKISKYKPEASVQVVNPQEHQVGEESVDNLIEAASPFIYIPEFSGLAYQHVWNHLQKEQFERFFAELILAKYSNFFVICEVDPVVDLRTFVLVQRDLDFRAVCDKHSQTEGSTCARSVTITPQTKRFESSNVT